ncbi:MAG TPA: hypothetical protein VNM69_10375 [Bacillus sp. (in: firmicutes)]|uniref:hypothetical protein n=1 Tax=Bacillus litorisediminis TaxID=2922713 RepID=UPI001FACDF91|nr:hypothetical protein [Bacillus litorisediminis]HWO76285.1 hypothetical protein [Bacillus sp. (in: firmicutes)]
MEKRKKAKFNVGDTVVIVMYGTVGKITNIKTIEETYVYEVNHSEGLFLESALVLLSEYDGEVVNKEQIDIEYKFIIGDLVQVKDRGAELFKVIGFRTEIWRYKEDAWEDIVYELSSVKDGQWLEVGEEDLTLIADAQHADTYMQKLGFLFMTNKKSPSNKINLDKKGNSANHAGKKSEIEKKKEAVDQLLDLYNDYKLLFEWFGNQEYKTGMKMTVKKLKILAKEMAKIYGENTLLKE